MKLSIEKILSIYIALTPVFWFWFIPTGVMIPLKFLMLIFIIIFLIVLQKRKIKKEYAIFFILFTVAFIPAIIRTSIMGWLYKYFLFLLIILTIAAFYNFFRNKKIEEIINFLKFPSLFVAGLCLITVINYFTGVPDWREAEANKYWPVYLYQTGFSAARTSWTPSIALFFISNLYFFFHERKSKNKVLFLLAAIVIIMSQIFAGGRTGLLISISAIAYYIFIKVNTKVLFMLFLAVLIIIIPNLEEFLRVARLDHIDFTSFEALDNFSTGRLSVMVEGIERIFQDYNFFIGAGFDHEDCIFYLNGLEEVEIHNFWLNSFARGGILLLLFYVLFSLYYVLKSIVLYKNDKRAEIFMLFILCGLVGTLVEPQLILGKVQTTIVWWIAIVSVDVVTEKKMVK